MSRENQFVLMDKQQDWPESVKKIIREPALLDRLTSADLKRVGKMLTVVVCQVGHRAQRAEVDLAKNLKLQEMGVMKTLDRLTARNLELTGGRPPAWSYLFRANVEHLHTFTEFEAKKTSKGYQVQGITEDGQSLPLYDYDYSGLGVTQAQAAARLMTVHLRQCFVPREMQQ